MNDIVILISDDKIIGKVNDEETIVFTKLLNYYQPEIVDKTADVEILENLLIRIMQIISQI